MADNFSRKKRSYIMSRIAGKNTLPEKKVRKILWGMGYRYKLHVRALPGCPDIVLPGLRKVVFVHGCFWHGHKNCRRSECPKTNGRFWRSKLGENILRDTRVKRRLKSRGWKSLIVWECRLRDETKLRHLLKTFTNDK